MRVLDLALKDLFQLIRDRKTFLFLLIMPVVFTAFMGFALGRGNQAEEVRWNVSILNQDINGTVSNALVASLMESAAIKVQVLDTAQPTEVETLVRQGKVEAVVLIPANYSEQNFAGETAQIKVFVDSASQAGQLIRTEIINTVTRLMSAAEIARLSVNQQEEIAAFADPESREMALVQAFDAAVANWKEPLFRLEMKKAVARDANPDVLQGNTYNQSSPGMIVMFAIFGLVNTALILVTERKSHALARLMTTSMKRSEIILGHLLAMFAIVFLQQVVLAAAGQVLFKVNYIREIGAVLLVMAALSMWVAALGLMISVLVKTEEQVNLFSLIAMFIFSALGGTWFPLEIAGRGFEAIGRWMPTAWAMKGFQDVLVRGLGFQEVLPAVGMLVLYAVIFFAIAVWGFRRLEVQ